MIRVFGNEGFGDRRQADVDWDLVHVERIATYFHYVNKRPWISLLKSNITINKSFSGNFFKIGVLLQGK